ncbi:FAD-dependent monooxygenase [Enemella evansiae]|uniref:FAD-dependent monooxygenase n=1 Tax=Enemella evansiae TaxID=2016499 RepID=UPI0015C642CC|nr:FAD-dependent monooxygenase [Enemella evansiae]
MTTDYDVIQIGFGPVGHISTALLAQNDHSVGIFERSPEQYPLPRAGHIDHEIMRIFQGVGAAHEFEKFAIPIPDYDMLNKHGQVLIHLDWNAPTPSGWKSDYLIYQPHMEDALCEAMGRIGGYDLHRGWEATAIVQHPDHVEVHVRENRRIDGSWQAAGPERVVTAKYLIGADGAGSFTRRTVGIEMNDLGFEHDWLVTDIRPHDPDVFVDMPQGGAQVCDPARPTSMFRWLGRNHLRWEFKLRDDEKPEEMATEEKVFELLAKWDVGPDRFDIIRRTVYTFRSLLARSFRKDRVLLIGDAAHLMPPFMGQGMCSGIRDATALAWRLDLILRGRRQRRAAGRLHQRTLPARAQDHRHLGGARQGHLRHRRAGGRGTGSVPAQRRGPAAGTLPVADGRFPATGSDYARGRPAGCAGPDHPRRPDRDGR